MTITLKPKRKAKKPKPGLILRPILPKEDSMGGNTFEDHYRRWLLQDAAECNKRLRQAMVGA
jgi:hypothetical protein